MATDPRDRVCAIQRAELSEDGAQSPVRVSLRPEETTQAGLFAQGGQITTGRRRIVGDSDRIGDSHEAVERGDGCRRVDQPGGAE